MQRFRELFLHWKDLRQKFDTYATYETETDYLDNVAMFCVAKSSHLVTNLMTDTQTDRHADKARDWVKNKPPSFKGIITR